MINVIADTCFWFAFCTPSDQYHTKSQNIFNYLENYGDIVRYIIPYPTLYETLNTRFLNNNNVSGSKWFIKQLKSNPKFEKLDDEKYKISLDKTLNRNEGGLSLVDNYICAIIDDKHDQLDGLLSFNNRDFGLICNKYNIQLFDNTFDAK